MLTDMYNNDHNLKELYFVAYIILPLNHKKAFISFACSIKKASNHFVGLVNEALDHVFMFKIILNACLIRLNYELEKHLQNIIN